MLAFERVGEGAQAPLGEVCIRHLPSLDKHPVDPGPRTLGQVLEHVTKLVDLTALHDTGGAKDVADRPT